MKIKTHHDDFTGTTYTVMLAEGVCTSFTSVRTLDSAVVLSSSGNATTLAGNAAERFLAEWQRVTGERVSLPVTAEEF